MVITMEGPSVGGNKNRRGAEIEDADLDTSRMTTGVQNGTTT